MVFPFRFPSVAIIRFDVREKRREEVGRLGSSRWVLFVYIKRIYLSRRARAHEVALLSSLEMHGRALYRLSFPIFKFLLPSLSRPTESLLSVSLTRNQCDEQHPACRNCQKSKRECLGYDPIFKQQPGPAAIQPAPSSAPSLGGMVATSNPYGQQPQMLTNYGAPPANMSSYDRALSAGVSSPGSVHPQYDYTNAIDPALADVAAAPPVNTTAPTYQTTSPGM